MDTSTRSLLRSLAQCGVLLIAGFSSEGCRQSATAAPGYATAPAPPPTWTSPPGPAQAWPPPQPGQSVPQAQPVPQINPAAAQRPLLPPLVGVAAQQEEVRRVLAELVAALPAQSKALVQGIPLSFDPTTEVNAFAGCDEQGSPFLAATLGMLEAVDAIAQTRATDELFGTRTYDAYAAAVLPAMTQSDRARAGLPGGIIPANLGPDARRWSRARELFDDVIAFTFGHELAHHYLGHTGCAKGQPMGAGPDPARLGRLLSAVPLFNQVGESQADSAGCINALNAGRARRPQFEWSENGGILLLDYFARLERAGGGGGPLSLLSPVQFLRTHPNPLTRLPFVQAVAQTWRLQQPR